jgi:hypothetical protein
MRVRWKVSEEEGFLSVLDKLAGMSDRSRRRTRVWAEIRKLLEATGNWKKAPRGKPGIKNLFKPRDSF